MYRYSRASTFGLHHCHSDQIKQDLVGSGPLTIVKNKANDSSTVDLVLSVDISLVFNEYGDDLFMSFSTRPRQGCNVILCRESNWV